MTRRRRAGARAEQNALRLGMLGAGMTSAEIADEFIRRYQYLPRAALRHAHGWTLLRAAEYINTHAARLDLDPHGRVPMTAPHLSELENWPYPAERRRLTPQVLALLASVYGADVPGLLDGHDRARLRPADRLVIHAMVYGGGCGRSRELAAARPWAPAPASLGALAANSVLGSMPNVADKDISLDDIEPYSYPDSDTGPCAASEQRHRARGSGGAQFPADLPVRRLWHAPELADLPSREEHPHGGGRAAAALVARRPDRVSGAVPW